MVITSVKYKKDQKHNKSTMKNLVLYCKSSKAIVDISDDKTPECDAI